MATQNLVWIKLEDSNIPQFTIANITNYFITRISYDGKPANDLGYDWYRFERGLDFLKCTLEFVQPDELILGAE